MMTDKFKRHTKYIQDYMGEEYGCILDESGWMEGWAEGFVGKFDNNLDGDGYRAYLVSFWDQSMLIHRYVEQVKFPK